MPGYWRRPVARVYSYNLDLGENYYSPMKEYVEKKPSEGASLELPGALAYSERIARKFMESDSDRLLRAKSEMRGRESRARMEARDRAAVREAIRATSERATSERREQQFTSSRPPSRPTTATGYQAVHGSGLERAESVINQHRRLVRDISEETTRRVSDHVPQRYADDCIYKKMADIRISPWRGDEVEIEQKAAQQARARIHGLERDLDNITNNLMTSRSSYSRSAKEMAERAMREEEMNTTSTRTKRVEYSESRRRE